MNKPEKGVKWMLLRALLSSGRDRRPPFWMPERISE
jgi:hypothetical protein